MAVAIYGQLDRLLRERNLTIDDLKRQIEQRYGLVVEDATLDRIARPTPEGYANLTAAGAAASVLGVGLDDLFAVSAISIDDDPSKLSFLSEDETQRLWALQDLQDERKLSHDEQHELEGLMETYGRRLNDFYRQREAHGRGVSAEQVEHEEAERIAKATSWLASLESDPARYAAFVERVKQQRASSLR